MSNSTTTLTLAIPSEADSSEPLTEEEVQLLSQHALHYNYFALPIRTGLKLAHQIFAAKKTEFQALGLDYNQLPHFLRAVQCKYPNNAFHNFYHALSVLEMADRIICKSARGRALPAEFQLACLIAAFCHDIGHRGYTNAFETQLLNANADCDQQPVLMERMHASLTRSVLADCALLSGAGMSKKRLDRIHQCIFEAIMGTDMRVHANFVGPTALDSLCAQDEFFVCGVVKVSDLSSQTLGEDAAQVWGRRITHEFNNQVIWEDANGWKATVPFCATETDYYKGQVFFISHFAAPLWRTFVSAAPELQSHLQQLEANQARYAQLAIETEGQPFQALQRRGAVTAEPPKPPPAVVVVLASATTTTTTTVMTPEDEPRSTPMFPLASALGVALLLLLVLPKTASL